VGEQDDLRTIHKVHEAFEGYEDNAAAVAAFTDGPG
jgi:hypothetical protein